MHDTLMDEHELAAKLGISIHTVRAMRSRPELKGPPYIKIGKSTIRYSSSALEKYLAQQTTDPTKPVRSPRR